jgi:enoyl-CoA hydratase/carnithine racemase
MTDELLEHVSVQRDGAVAIVTLNRPVRRNARDIAMRRAIADAFIEPEADAHVRAIVITGGPRVFAAGADLNSLVGQGRAGRGRYGPGRIVDAGGWQHACGDRPLSAGRRWAPAANWP